MILRYCLKKWKITRTIPLLYLLHIMKFNEAFLSAKINFMTLLIPELQDEKVDIFEQTALDTI